MTPRYLFGPVDQPFVERHLRADVRAGRCVAFDHLGMTGVQAGPLDSWDHLAFQFPPGWQPDSWCCTWPNQVVPSWLWSAPIRSSAGRPTGTSTGTPTACCCRRAKWS